MLKPEPLSAKPEIVHYDVGVGLLAALLGGIAPGVRMDLLRMRGDRGIGWQANLVLPATREVALGANVSRYTRASAGVALNARFRGIAAAYTLVWGQGYAVNQTGGQSFTYGLVTGVRAGIPWGRLRLWTDLRAVKWLYNQGVQIDSGVGGDSTTIALPTWDAQWALGLSYAFR